jgi:chromosome segregation ATPase
MTNAMYLPQPGGPGAYERQLADRCHRAEQDRTTLENELGQARRRSAELQQRVEQLEAALLAAAKQESTPPEEQQAPIDAAP